MFLLTSLSWMILYSHIREGMVMLEARQERGFEIAATAKIAKKGGAWLVPSQSGKGRYTVCLDPPNLIAVARTTKRAASSASTFSRWLSSPSPAPRPLRGGG